MVRSQLRFNSQPHPSKFSSRRGFSIASHQGKLQSGAQRRSYSKKASLNCLMYLLQLIHLFLICDFLYLQISEAEITSSTYLSPRMTSIPIPTPNSTPAPSTGFERALKAFERRLTPIERAQFSATSVDDLKVTILSIQADQRARKQMMNMGRVKSFLEAMEQFGKVIEVFLNVNNILCFVWGPMKLLLLVCMLFKYNLKVKSSYSYNLRGKLTVPETATAWSDSLDALLDAYQEISENFPVFAGYESIFAKNEGMQVLLECVWSNILDFHIRALRIFDQSSMDLSIQIPYMTF